MGCNKSKEKKPEEPKQSPAQSKPVASVPTTYRGAKLFNRSDFTVENFIQEGGQGKVYVGRHNETEKLYALKVSRKM